MKSLYRNSWARAIGRTVVVGAVVSLALTWQQSAIAGSICTRSDLSRQLLWISSATWASNLGRLLVVDPLQNKLILVSSTGKVEFLDDKRLVAKASEMMPALIEYAEKENSIILKMIDDRLFWLDRNMGIRKKSELANASAGAEGRIGSTYDWVAAGDYVLAYGSVKEGGKHRFGFYRWSLQKIKNFNFVRDFQDVDYYLLGHKYLASLGSDGYFLQMSSEGQIYRVPADGHGRAIALKAFPEDYKSIPRLRAVSAGPSSDKALFEEIEGLKIPVGLYGGFDGFLYLLTRQPREDRKTLWLLHQIDPRRDQVLGQIELPTSAAHLTIVPGRDNWYVFEKGPVQSASQQRIATMLTIPSSLIRSRAMLE